MLYLTTGANGAGKTLLTLRDVREKSLKESRPVYWNGRFKLTADFGWHQIDAKDWQSVPDGAIFLFDECHNDFPLRGTGAVVPEHVKMLAEHRARGFDFFLITQHPMNMDAFVRRLIGPPGWHRHIKRASGAKLCSVTTYSEVNPNCEKSGANDKGSTSMVAYPKEVFGWYESTMLDTAKVKIPLQAKVLVLCVPLFLGTAYLAVKLFRDRVPGGGLSADAKKPATSGPGQAGQLRPPGAAASAPVAAPMSTADYVASFQPRLPGLSYSAPRYDGVTAATVAPYPAACVKAATECRCYTQQATRLDVPPGMCAEIVAKGFFVDWRGPAPVQAGGVATRSPAGSYAPSSGDNMPSRLQAANSRPPDAVGAGGLAPVGGQRGGMGVTPMSPSLQDMTHSGG